MPGFRLRNRLAMVDGWLRSRALTGLREINFSYSTVDPQQQQQPPPMPPSALRFTATLRVAKFGYCDFPTSRSFPWSRSPYQRTPFTACSLAATFWRSSCWSAMSALAACASVPQLLRSIGFSGPSEAIEFQELVVEDAPRLERLLPLEPGRGPATIRVMRASKLEKVGLLSAAISKLEFGTTAFQEMMALSLGTSMATVRVLALESLGPNLDSVLDFLKCFPCVEKLYITFNRLKTVKNARIYNPLYPIECLELHLKKVVVNYLCRHETRS
ncbi:hypothetical protein PVAP13_5NG379581 [Panicum virgatum]|uniref:F-box/LRR-repeat protein 15/At3g58940/PEG3-like LRR domain-containing protein n=1 Tax=Panicum virgatum TaxID=38727 RepID=A0A8T0RY17_PANVG|nr:hypothetical protein PVAP13_5NG379581 [Panicum virgatum]